MLVGFHLLRLLRRRLTFLLAVFEVSSCPPSSSSSGSSASSVLCSSSPIAELPSSVPLLFPLRSCKPETSFNCERRVVRVPRVVLVALVSQAEAGDERGSSVCHSLGTNTMERLSAFDVPSVSSTVLARLVAAAGVPSTEGG